jgi:hypothetical protein
MNIDRRGAESFDGDAERARFSAVYAGWHVTAVRLREREGAEMASVEGNEAAGET